MLCQFWAVLKHHCSKLLEAKGPEGGVLVSHVVLHGTHTTSHDAMQSGLLLLLLPACGALCCPAPHAYLVVPVCLLHQEHDALKEPAQEQQQRTGQLLFCEGFCFCVL